MKKLSKYSFNKATPVITVGARASNLAKVQLEEVHKELLVHYPSICFQPIYLSTTGDKDRSTSLRTLGKSNFFTLEIDLLQLEEKCRISIHSAKDLPEPLAEGLELVALTKGVDGSDSLVLKEGVSLAELPKGAVIATSSERREKMVKTLRDDFSFVDVRGVIEERLALITDGKVDGVVVAEAALIRLQLTHLNRVRVPGMAAPLQGQLAIIARSGDEEMKQLFAPIDVRQNTL